MNNLSALPPLKHIIEQHGLLAKKSLGQHFLLDGRITDDIARYAGSLADCSVIEVGPGPGGLTRSLLKEGAKKLYVIEKDARCLAIMQELKNVAGDALEILHADALEIDITTIPAPRKIVANLPYNVGTQLLLNWLEVIYQNTLSLPGRGQGEGITPNSNPHLNPPPERGRKVIESMTLMFQKEVAERITATHGNKDYGRLSIVSQWLCEVRTDMDLPPGAFVPPPKVSSQVVTLTPRAKPLVDVKKETLEKVVAAAFGQRRKMLRQALKPLGCDTEKLLAAAGIEGTLRAEQVDVKTLCILGQTCQQLFDKK